MKIATICIMQTTTIVLPKDLAREVEEQVEKGKFSSRSAFIRLAIETYLRFQKGKLSWEILATPFRAFAKAKGLTENDVLKAVEKGRRGKASKSNQ